VSETALFDPSGKVNRTLEIDAAEPAADSENDPVIDLTTNTITIAQHGLTTGQQVTYIGGGSDTEISADNLTESGDIGGLTSRQSYFVIVIDANTIQLATTESNATSAGTDAASNNANGNAIDLTSYGEGLLPHELTYVQQSKVNTTNDTITLQNHGLLTGQKVSLLRWWRQRYRRPDQRHRLLRHRD
jgi:hypothetical protein